MPDAAAAYQAQHPVVLIICQRPDTTSQVLDAVRQVRPSQMFVIADGTGQEQSGAIAARQVIETVDWECNVTRIYADSSVKMGIKQRVESGLETVFVQVDTAIILEDDCVPHPSFFRYCDVLLDRYAANDRVMSISGDNFTFSDYNNGASYRFSRYPHSTGWATWRRAWQRYDPLMRDWERLRNTHWLKDKLVLPYAIQYWHDIFQRNYRTRDTWDYNWMFACWLHDALCINPNVNLVQNIGFRADATHTKDASSKYAQLNAMPIEFPLRHPARLERDVRADELTEQNNFSGCSLPAMFAAARAHIEQKRHYD